MSLNTKMTEAMDLRQLKDLSKTTTPNVTWYYGAVRRGDFAIVNWLLKQKKIPINLEVLRIAIANCQREMIIYFGKQDVGNINYLQTYEQRYMRTKPALVDLRALLREYRLWYKTMDEMLEKKDYASFYQFLLEYRTDYETANLSKLWHEEKQLIFDRLLWSCRSHIQAGIAMRGNLDLLKWLKQKNMYENNSFYEAATGGHVNLLEWMDDPDIKTPYSSIDYDHVLHAGIIHGRIEVMDWALSKGAKLEYCTSLHYVLKAFIEKHPTPSQLKVIQWCIEKDLVTSVWYDRLFEWKCFDHVLLLKQRIGSKDIPVSDYMSYFLEKRCTQHLDITLDKNRNCAAYHYADMLLHNKRIDNCPMCQSFGKVPLKDEKISEIDQKDYERLERSFPVRYYCFRSSFNPYSVTINNEECLKRLYIPCVGDTMTTLLK